MKRYIVFGGSYYYPSGGMNDMIKKTDSLDSAMKSIEKQKKDAWFADWFHILDTHTGKIIKID